MKALLLLAVAAATNPPGDPYPAVWTCTLASQEYCDASGCTTAKPTVYTMLSERSHEYHRCDLDRSGCSTAAITVSRAGGFLTASAPGLIVRIGGDLSFSEVATFLHGYYIAHGTCAEGPPPIIIRQAH
jgi:hypothetical protein